MKYIDADKLIAEIERQKRENLGSPECVCDDILSFIASLQQEQSLPCWIHANYSDKPEVRYTPSGIPYLQNGTHMIWLSDLEMLPKDGTDSPNFMQR